MHDAEVTGERRGSERSSVDVEGCAVSEHDVSRARLADARIVKASRGFASVPPDWLSVPGVIVVRPDEELQALPRELEMGTQVVHRLVVLLGVAQRRRVEGQLHDDRLALEPSPMKGRHRANRVGESLVVDEDPGALPPWLGRGHPWQHDDAAAKLRRTWHCHWANVPEGCTPDLRLQASPALTSEGSRRPNRRAVDRSPAVSGGPATRSLQPHDK